jgi:acetoin utilization deacetylase AcuC-like enzyme
MKTGFAYDIRFRDHDTGPRHPECSARLDTAMTHLETQPWFTALHRVAARRASIADIESTHSLDYIRRAQLACQRGTEFLDCADVTISADSYEVALLAAGTPLALADSIMRGEIDNAFAMLRPPGHHAERDAAMGFCLFNNVAIVARYLRQQYGLDKIAIVDWDVHHGNGTQHSFEEDAGVLYISLHQYPFYPGTGAASETGVGPGVGATVNCPLPAGSDDALYVRTFRDTVMPALRAFKPQCVLVSAGFDAHADDPLAAMQLSAPVYGWMTGQLKEIADSFSGGRLLSVLEGGYHLQRLGECVAAHLAVLCGERENPPGSSISM